MAMAWAEPVMLYAWAETSDTHGTATGLVVNCQLLYPFFLDVFWEVDKRQMLLAKSSSEVGQI